MASALVGIGKEYTFDFSLDREYMGISEDQIRTLVWEAHWPIQAGWHPEFPDCDDHARCCHTDIIKWAANHGFKRQPVFGIATVLTERGNLHMVNWALAVRPMKFLLYEPQVQKWVKEEEYAQVEELAL